jgi:hypothetical protein
MEGKFHRFFKEARHPHTNMAKAALNMLTIQLQEIYESRNFHECGRYRLGDRRRSG